MEKTWKEMSKFERLKYLRYSLCFAVGYFGLGAMLSYMNNLVALPMFVLAVLFFSTAEHMKTRKILLDELRGGK